MSRKNCVLKATFFCNFLLRLRHIYAIIVSAQPKRGKAAVNTGDRIKQMRIAKGMTLEDLGQKVGVGKSTVRKWETGAIANMKRDKIAKLAEALDTTVNVIIGVEDTDVEMTDKQIEFIRILSQLTDQEVAFLLAQVQGLLQSRQSLDGQE